MINKYKNYFESITAAVIKCEKEMGRWTAMDKTQMKHKLIERPRNRSQFRLYIGKYYFTCKRSFLWLKQYRGYARQRNHDIRLPYLVVNHFLNMGLCKNTTPFIYPDRD